MSALAAWWTGAWFGRFDPLGASLFRITTGALMFAMFLALEPDWERFYAADGVLSLGASGASRPTDWWCVFVWTEQLAPIRAYWWLGLLASAGFAAGWMTRVWTVALYVLQTSMIHRNLMAVNGEDLIFRLALFYNCCAPLNRTLSVDSWLRNRRLRAANVADAHPLRASGRSACCRSMWPSSTPFPSFINSPTRKGSGSAATRCTGPR